MRTWVASTIGLALLGAVAGTLWYVNAPRGGLDRAELRRVAAEAAGSTADRRIRHHSYRAVSGEVRHAVEEAARRLDLPVPHVDVVDAENRPEDVPGGYLTTYQFQLTDEVSGLAVCLVLDEKDPRKGPAGFEPWITEGECRPGPARNRAGTGD
ncbi:hypothetical protein [Streptomyces carminius]|uniref:hypothetical protein n=1 Tax=Streptomyces carminius TaxID=2665496 RepID=UPI0011B67F97|nr:hypothetical protein [Streptomyces carminius]